MHFGFGRIAVDFPASASSVKPIITSIAVETIMQFAGCDGNAGLAMLIAVAVSWTILIRGFFVSLLLSGLDG
jgi:hypothetical protein